jgi:hypothetical protein
VCVVWIAGKMRMKMCLLRVREWKESEEVSRVYDSLVRGGLASFGAGLLAAAVSLGIGRGLAEDALGTGRLWVDTTAGSRIHHDACGVVAAGCLLLAGTAMLASIEVLA